MDPALTSESLDEPCHLNLSNARKQDAAHEPEGLHIKQVLEANYLKSHGIMFPLLPYTIAL